MHFDINARSLPKLYHLNLHGMVSAECKAVVSLVCAVSNFLCSDLSLVGKCSDVSGHFPK